MKTNFLTFSVLILLVLSCNSEIQNNAIKENSNDSALSCSPNYLNKNNDSNVSNLSEAQKLALAKSLKDLKAELPTIGILMYNKVLTTELTAPMDVFTKNTKDGKQLFNVITIAENYDMIVSEEGLKMFPDYIFSNAPQLDVMIIPSAYDMASAVKDKAMVEFIKSQNNNTKYTMSNCAGAQLVGESGIAKGKKIVTWIGGGKDLQKTYPDLKVMDDGNVSYVEDGKFSSSNGNLASYISALELLEKLSGQDHRKFVESYLYLDRLKNWKK